MDSRVQENRRGIEGDSRTQGDAVAGKVSARAQQSVAVEGDEDLCRQIVRGVAAAIYTTDAQGRILQFNEAAVKLWGRRPDPGEKWCGSWKMFRLNGEQIAAESCPMAVTVRDRRSLESEELIVERPDGTRRRVLPHPQPLYGPDGTFIGAANLLVDITERAELESELRDTDERYQAIVENLTEMVCRFRPDGTILFVNEAYAHMRGTTVEDLRGRNFWEFIPPEDQPAVRALLAGLKRASPEVRIENRLETAKGVRWTLWTNRGLAFSEDGEATEVQSCGVDITDRKLAEHVLRESEVRFRTMADAAPVLIWVSGTDKKFQWLNRRWLDFTGRPIEEETGDGWLANVHSEDVEAVRNTYSRAFDSRMPFWMEYRLLRHDGEHRWVLAHGVPMYGVNDEFTGYIGSCVDIHDRRLAEKDREFLLRLERSARTEAEALNDVSLKLSGELDLQQVVQKVTDAGRAVTGAAFGAFFYTVKNESNDAYMLYALSGAPREAFDKFGMPRRTPIFDRTFGGGVMRSDDIQAHPNYGRNAPHKGMPEGHLPVRSYLAVPVISRSGENIGGLFFGHPEPGVFTERAERLAIGLAAQAAIAIDNARLYQSLKDSEQRLRTLSETLPALVWVCAPDGTVTHLNAHWETYTGASRESSLGMGWVRHIHPEEQEELLRNWEQARTRGTTYEGECRYRRHDGEYRWHYFRGVPLRDAEGQVTAWYGSSLDIHDQRVARDALLETERRFRQWADTAPAVLWMTSPEGGCTFLSRGWYDFTGQTEAEALGLGWLQAVHPEDRERCASVFQSANARHVPFEFDYRLRRADGTYRWAIDAGRPRFSAKGEFEGFIGSVIDVHERKEAEAALRTSEERFRTLADNMSQFAWMADEKGSIIWYNQRWYDYTGTNFDEMKGWGWMAVHHPDHIERVVKRVQHSWDTGELWEDVFPLRSKDGEYRWFLSRAVPIRDASGKILRWFGTNTDITERREMEEQLAKHRKELERRVEERTQELTATYERLRMAERMAMMGTLSAGLGHDMGNLLLPLRIRLDSLAKQDLKPQAREDVEAIRTSAEYLRRLAGGLRLLALDPERASPGETTELAPWWADAQSVFASVLPRGIELEASIPSGVFVEMSRAALTQVVFNLIQNAGDAMKDQKQGSVRVTVERSGEGVEIRVRDTGPGMTDEVRKRCMEPYFSTKSRGLSTGLGLVLVYGLVQEVHGSVEIESALGAGTCFKVRLRDAANTRSTDHGRGRTARVELQNARLRSFVSGELRSLGVQIDQGVPGPMAVDVFVLDDAKRLGALPGGARVILLAEGTGPGVTALGSNPTFSEIRAAIRGILNSPGPIVQGKVNARVTPVAKPRNGEC